MGLLVALQVPHALDLWNTDYRTPLHQDHCTKLKAFVLDFHFYLGLDGLHPGLYFRMHTPATWVQTEIELCEEKTNDGTDTLFPELYMDNNTIAAPATSAKTPFEGNTTYGHVQEGMQFGTIQGISE